MPCGRPKNTVKGLEMKAKVGINTGMAK